MPDFSHLDTIFSQALPQVWEKKYPDKEWTRTVSVTTEAEDNFVVKRTKVLISPKVFDDNLNLLKFCTRIVSACWDFDRLEARRNERLLNEFEERLTKTLEQIHQRWGPKVVEQMMLNALDDKVDHPDFAVNEYAVSPILPQQRRPEVVPAPGTKEITKP